MKKRLGIVITSVAAALLAVPAMAHEAGTWIVKGGAGMVSPKDDNMFLETTDLATGDTIDGSTIQVDDGSSLVLSATYMLNKNWGVDILAAAPFEHDFEITGTIGGSPVAVPVGKTKHLPPTVSLQYHFAPDAAFQPFVGLGINYTTFFSESLRPEIPGATGIVDLDIKDSSGIAAKLGADWVINDDWLVSLDARWIQIQSDIAFDLDLAPFGGGVATGVELPPQLEVDPWVFSLMVGYRFGGGGTGFADSDGDGVEDRLDRCPNTPPAASVDSYGCEMDSDGDGVKDSKDNCPNTPAGASVDGSGCPVDTDKDGDGVSDNDDECPNTVQGARVDARGCELDGDRDGVVDRLDQCRNSATGVQVDVNGCEIKGEIRLPGVNFESNSDRLVPGATMVLAEAVATLKKNPTIIVEVAGHTDGDGAADYNASLSARRATTVRDYLADNGIADDRMSVRGYGESQPIADNATAAGKAQNRRVVLRILQR